MTSLQLRTHEGELLTITFGERLRLEENRRYELVLNEELAPCRVYWGGVFLAPDLSGVTCIRTGHWVGDTVLRVESATENLWVSVSVQPRAEKLSDSVWVSMLQDLEAWLPGISTGAEGGRGGHVGSSGVSAPLIAEALTPLLPTFERAIRALLEQPKQVDVTVIEEVLLHKVRRVDRETLGWVSRHPELHAYLDPWKSMELTKRQPIVPQRKAVDIIDHQVNRYISWLVRRVERVLRNTAAGLDAVCNSNTMGETAFWCQDRSQNLRQGADQLLRLWRTSFLAAIPREPLTEAALQVVLDEPDYARVHKIGRLFLNPLFQLQRDGQQPPAAVRPSFTIYELWCFLAVGEQLKEQLPTWKWRTSGIKKLSGPSATGAGALHRAVSPTGDIVKVLFNATFAGYFSRSGKSRWSISGERRPDIIVSCKPHGRDGTWVCLDAKYRVGQSNLADAFSSVHIYRDALRYEGYGGRCKASMLLSPSRSDDTEEWFSGEYLKTYKEGVWELKPGLPSCQLGTWLKHVLLN